MNPHTYVFGSSRARCFEGKINCQYVHSKPGGKLIKLCEIAKNTLKNVDEDKIVYFIAGIPDICALDKNREQNYQESYLKLKDENGKIIDHVAKFKQLIDKVILYMSSVQNCKVVFATITTISFEVWNTTRLSQGKTNSLMYVDQYAEMQNVLNSSLMEINNFITEINRRQNVVTPFLHTPVQKSKYGKIRYMYSKLSDGVHPCGELSEIWIDRLHSAIKENEDNL